MKVKELMSLLTSARDKFYATFVDYDIYTYLDGTEKEVICSVRSDYKKELFLNEKILNSEVEKIGIKSEDEIVFKLEEDWLSTKEPEVVDVRCPSRALDVTITKNEFGLADVTIRDLEEDDMLEMLKNICLQFDVSGIADKEGKWSYSFTDNSQTFTDEGGNDDAKDLSSS